MVHYNLMPQSKIAKNKIYNKLIRDKIPEIIISAGEKPQIRILKHGEYRRALIKKVSEEAVELGRAKSEREITGEIVDIQELIDTLIVELGLTKRQVKQYQTEKSHKRGVFKKRLFLIKTIVPALAKPKRIRMTGCWVVEKNRILLGMKKRGFGAGRWNGFGGKVKPGERVETAAIRELSEEVGLIPADLSKRGILEFQNEGVNEILEVHEFRIRKHSGKILESEEMKPRWFPLNKIPYSKMWPDDKHWLPIFLAGKKFKGSYKFRDNKIILSQELKTVQVL